MKFSIYEGFFCKPNTTWCDELQNSYPQYDFPKNVDIILNPHICDPLDIVILCDQQMHNIERFNNRYIFGAITECEEIMKKLYHDNIYQVVSSESFYRKFTHIYTYNEMLLNLSPVFQKFIYGGTSLLPNDFGIYPKTKNISMFASNKNITSGHFIRRECIEYIKNCSDCFGAYFNNYLYNKINGLKDYKYSIVIENSKAKSYLTEKIIDCFLTGTIPIYWGAPDIDTYFDKDGIIMFNNLDELKLIISNIDDNDYKLRSSAIISDQ